MERGHGVARPRAGLLGNPSDGYGGRVISFTFDDFVARATMKPSEGAVLHAPGEAPVRGADWPALLEDLRPRTLAGGSALLAAAALVFDAHAREHARSATRPDPRLRCRLGFTTDIPRQVGLAGSSAVVVSALRALASWFEVPIAPLDLARLALRAETEWCGIAAGPQDRVVQALEGLVDMDFSGPWRARHLDPDLLPPLFLAWSPGGGKSSGGVHDRVRRRFDRGDPEVVEAMRAFAALAAEGARRIECGDGSALGDLLDQSFEQRAAIWELDDVDRALVAIGRAHGAGVTLCGSGGGVVGVLDDAARADALAQAYAAAGFVMVRPQVTRPERRGAP